MREHRVRSGRVELAVRERGESDRPTVLLLHGFPDTGRVWDEVAEHLAERFHVVTYDVRGAGASTALEGPENYRMEFLLEDLRSRRKLAVDHLAAQRRVDALGRFLP